MVPTARRAHRDHHRDERQHHAATDIPERADAAEQREAGAPAAARPRPVWMGGVSGDREVRLMAVPGDEVVNDLLDGAPLGHLLYTAGNSTGSGP